MDLFAPPSQSASTTSNDIGIQTLEGYILPLLPQAPIFLNNLHFKIDINPNCYHELDLPYYNKNIVSVTRVSRLISMRISTILLTKMKY